MKAFLFEKTVCLELINYHTKKRFTVQDELVGMGMGSKADDFFNSASSTVAARKENLIVKI